VRWRALRESARKRASYPKPMLPGRDRPGHCDPPDCPIDGEWSGLIARTATVSARSAGDNRVSYPAAIVTFALWWLPVPWHKVRYDVVGIRQPRRIANLSALPP